MSAGAARRAGAVRVPRRAVRAPIPQEGDTLGIWDAEAAPARSYGTSSTPCRRPIGWSRRRTGRCRATLCGAAAGGSERDRQVQDWSHGNSAGMAADGSVLISLGHLNQVISIAPDSGPVRRRLGGSGSAFTFADPRDRFYPPHTALPLANGNVLLFDNGTGRPYAEGSQYSRALELELGLQRIVTRRARESGPRCTPRAAPACSACPTAPTATPDPVYGSSRRRALLPRVHHRRGNPGRPHRLPRSRISVKTPNFGANSGRQRHRVPTRRRRRETRP